MLSASKSTCSSRRAHRCWPWHDDSKQREQNLQHLSNFTIKSSAGKKKRCLQVLLAVHLVSAAECQ